MPGRNPKATQAAQDFKEILQLKNADKKQIESVIAQLKQWSAQNKEMPKADLPVLERLARFGVKTPEETRLFAESPAGEALLEAMIEEALAEIAAIENARFEQREHLLHKKLWAAFLMLGLLYKRNAHAHESINHALEEFSKALNGEKTLHLQAATPAENVSHELNNYTSPAAQVEAMLHNTIAQSEQLEKQLAEMEPIHQATQAKYATFNSHLDDAHAKFAALMESGPKTSSTEGSSLAEKTETLLKAITQQIFENADAVSAALENDQEEQARILMNTGNALNLQAAMLREMLSVSEGKSIMYDDQHKPTTSFSNAAYVLALENKIVEDNGKHYLLRVGQELEGMTAEERNSAENGFKQLNKEETMSVRRLVHHNHQLENAPRDALIAQSDLLQRDLLLLAKQLSTLQEASSKAELALRPPAKAPALKMTPIAPSAAPTPSPRPAANKEELTESYRHILRLMASSPTPRAIQWLQTTLSGVETSPALKKQLNELKPGMPIPPATMTNLLAMKSVGRAWLNTSKPDIVEQDLKTPSTAPSPFSTRPRGMA